jgi:hypothetical protein
MTQNEGQGVKLTKPMKSALAWFSLRESAHLFGVGDPSLTMVRRLCDAGLVAAVGREEGRPFGFTRYAITDAGRKALETSNG